MLRLTSPKTYKVLLYMLSSSSFTQTEIRDLTYVSIGRVNKIVKWLIEKFIAIKDGTKYRIVRPNQLIELISMHATMKQKMFYQVSGNKKDIEHELKKNKVRFCFGNLVEDGTINVYYDKHTINILNEMERGETKINLYESNIKPIIDNIADNNSKTHKNDNEHNKKRKNTIAAIQTMIELYASENKILGQNIAKKIFGTLQ